LADIIAIVGLSKNAGKTTFLNWYLKGLPLDKQCVGITTTGRDGEDIDVVTALKKPKVCLRKGGYFTSFDYNANNNVEVIEKLPFRVVGKNIWLFRALADIETEVVGPSTLAEQDTLIGIFLGLGCESVLIDGSIDRRSIGLSEQITKVILVIGAATGSIEQIMEQAEMVRLYSLFPKKDIADYDCITYCVQDRVTETGIRSIYGNETAILEILKLDFDWVYFPGALTEGSWRKLQNNLSTCKGDVVFRSPISAIIPVGELRAMVEKRGLFCRVPFPLYSVVVNSFSPQGEHIDSGLLRARVKELFVGVGVVDVSEVVFS